MLPSKCGEFSPAFPLERGCFLERQRAKRRMRKKKPTAWSSGSAYMKQRYGFAFVARDGSPGPTGFRFWFSGIALLSNRPVDPAASAERVRAGSGCDQSYPLEACFVAGQAVEILVG